MTLEPRSPISRTLALGLTIAVVGAAWLVLVSPIAASMSEMLEENAALEARYAKYLDVASNLEAAKSHGSALRAQLSSRRLFFEEPSVDVAAARLQNQLAELVRANQGQMNVAHRVAADPKKPQLVSVSGVFTTSNAGLISILQALSGMKPVVLIDNLAVRSNIQPPHKTAGQPEPALPAASDPVLSVELQLSAFLSPPKSP